MNKNFSWNSSNKGYWMLNRRTECKTECVSVGGWLEHQKGKQRYLCFIQSSNTLDRDQTCLSFDQKNIKSLHLVFALCHYLNCSSHERRLQRLKIVKTLMLTKICPQPDIILREVTKKKQNKEVKTMHWNWIKVKVQFRASHPDNDKKNFRGKTIQTQSVAL